MLWPGRYDAVFLLDAASMTRAAAVLQSHPNSMHRAQGREQMTPRDWLVSWISLECAMQPHELYSQLEMLPERVLFLVDGFEQMKRLFLQSFHASGGGEERSANICSLWQALQQEVLSAYSL